MGKPTLRIIDNPSEFFTIREIWNDLLGKSMSNTAFLTWEWMYTWWECFGKGKKLFIILAQDQDALVGIAPLYIARERFFGLRSLKHLEFLGSTGVITEYQDFIILEDREQELISAFLEFLFENSHEWDAMNLVSMKQDGINLRQIRKYCEMKDIQYWEYDSSRSPYIEFSGSFDDYMQSLSRNSRWRIKSYKKKLENGRKVEMLETTDRRAVASDFLTIMHLHQKRWQQKGEKGSFAQSRVQYLKFHNDIVQRFFDNGWLYLLRLMVDEIPVAGQYNFIYNKRVYYHSVGFDPEWAEHNVGSVLQLNAIEDSIRKGAIEFDFLRGTEQYKYLWTKKERISVDTVFWRSETIARRVNAERIFRKTLKSFFPKAIVERIYRLLINRDT